MDNSGYIHVEPKLGNYIHGDGLLGTAPLVPGGQWDAFLPETHQQDENGFEPFDCVSEATINCTETLEIQEYGTNTKWARRFLAKESGTDKYHGNDPQTVSEALRTGGCVAESDYSFKASDFNTFYQTLTKALTTLGIGRFAEFAYGHSWVNANQADMMAALEYSPLSAAGYAWSQPDVNGYYVTPEGTQPDHDFEIYGYIANNYWKIRDSYFPFEKKLAWDYVFTGVKRHTLHRQIASTPTAQSAWEKFIELLQQIVDGMQQKLGLGDYARNFGATRSPQWAGVRATHLKKEPNCQLCGGTKDLQVHHIRPFHIHPELELEDTNLITLCTGNNTINCHIRFGHLDNFKNKWNPDIREDCQTWKARFDAIKEQEVFPNEQDTSV